MPNKKPWPIIKERKPGKRTPEIRKFEIQDARNTWIIEGIKTDKITFDIYGFSNFVFTYDGINLDCFKRKIERKSDSGKITCFDDRFNLVDDWGERKTLRLKNLKKYIKEIFQC